MAEITVAQISKLRGRTGAGIMDCKKALGEAEGDLDGAIEWLRKKGAATAEKKSSRATTEGVIARHLAADGQSGTLVEINCETDFSAKNEKFLEFCDGLATVLNENPEADLEDRRQAAVAETGENIQIARHESLAINGSGAVAAWRAYLTHDFCMQPPGPSAGCEPPRVPSSAALLAPYSSAG